MAPYAVGESVVRRMCAALVVVILVAGCEMALPGVPIQLVTGWGPFPGGGSCYTYFEVGRLVADQQSGTTFVVEGREPRPVMWRPGFTGRWDGSEVTVYDETGKEVARTGRSYSIDGAFWAEPVTPTKENHYAFEKPAVFLACAGVRPA